MEGDKGECGSSCCGSRSGPAGEPPPGRPGDAGDGSIPRVGTALTLADRLAGWKARWGIGRMRYRIAPGLYAVGTPDARSVVLVTANYRLSFDSLRKELAGLDAWILVLDTKGINVWCAAGKGTFGTEEVARRVEQSKLREVVSHRTLILPQLGAPGVAGYKVQQQAGFRVVFGPVRARDIRRFLAQGMKASDEMRRVGFGLGDRLAVVPIELVGAMKYFLLLVSALALWSAFAGGFSAARVLAASAPFLGAVLAGTLAVPTLLPWIPFRSFALKGWLLGAVWALAISLFQNAAGLHFAGNLLLLPALSAYLALNFTGSTTFTSQTGVNKEIRLFARPMAVSGILGILLLAGRFLG